MNSQIIALVDWRWAGHHPNYFVNYAVAMAKAGYQVMPFCDNPDDFTLRFLKVSVHNGHRQSI